MMSPFLQLALTLAVILFAAKLSAYLSARLQQPAVLGEIIIGLLLGPSLLNLLGLPFLLDTHLGDTIHEIGELGVLMLMFLAGLELHISELAKNTKVSALAGSLGVVVPVLLGWMLGLMLGMEPKSSNLSRPDAGCYQCQHFSPNIDGIKGFEIPGWPGSPRSGRF